MKDNKIIKITIFLVSILLIFIQSLEKVTIYVADILANLYTRTTGLEQIILSSYKDAFKTFLPSYIIGYILLITTLILIPYSLKNKTKLISKIIIIIIPILCISDIVHYFINGSTFLYGYVSIFLLIYSVIASAFVYNEKA